MLQLLQYFQSVHLWQVQVKEHTIGFKLIGRRQPLQTRGDCVYLVLLLQMKGESPVQLLLIINDQQHP